MMSQQHNPYLTHLEETLATCLKILEGDESSIENTRLSLKKYITEYEHSLWKEVTDKEAITYGKYGLVAYVDETLMSVGPYKGQWQLAPLGWEIFKDQCAGERFFDYLDSMMSNVSRYEDVIILYLHFLRLGFKGRYNLNAASDLKQFIGHLEETLKEKNIVSFEKIPLLTYKSSTQEKNHNWKYGKKQYGAGIFILLLAIYSGLQGFYIHEIHQSTKMVKTDEITTRHLLEESS